MTFIHAIILGIIEGLTEFLPVSSTGHLTIAEQIMGYPIDRPDITAFTAIIQLGATAATLLYFRADIIRIVQAWVRGVFDKTQRKDSDYRLGWNIIIGSIPIAIVGLALKDVIESKFRSLWVVAGALLLWTIVMAYADWTAKQNRHEKQVTWKDTLIIGVTQCLALIPGVSRSGATMSAGLLRGIDRVEATKLSFYLAIPALVAAGLLEAVSKAGDISNGVGWPSTIVATVVCFFVALSAIEWLLKYIAKHSFTAFILYRFGLGLLLVLLLAGGVLAAN